MTTMKDSGIEWIGKIPTEWKIERVGSLFMCRNEKVSDRDFAPLSVSKQGVVPQIETVAKSDNSDNRKLVLKDDFVINSRSDRKQSCGLSFLDGSVSLINIVLSIRNKQQLTTSFLPYVMKNYGFAEEFYKWGHGIVADLWTTRWQELKSIFIPLPPLPEQQRIADYLDKQCSIMDKLAEILQQQIEKLKEYKQSVITEAVTKGLDPNVAMKDSGIEWIGQIPQEWKVVLLSSIFNEHKQKNTDLLCSNLLSLSYGKIIKKNISTADGLLPVSFEGYNIVNKNDIVLRLTDLQNDQRSLRTGLVTEKIGIITSAYVTLRLYASNIASAKYMHYFLYAFDISKGFYAMGDGVRQSLNYDGCKKIQLLFPPLPEQQRIANYLDKKCEEIDKLIKIKQEKIDKLSEYKKSLIYECVTGKREVAHE